MPRLRAVLLRASEFTSILAHMTPGMQERLDDHEPPERFRDLLEQLTG